MHPAARLGRDNIATATVRVPAEGGLLTTRCKRGLLGEKRDCGFVEQTGLQPCVPGETTTLTCSVGPGDKPQALHSAPVHGGDAHGTITCT